MLRRWNHYFETHSPIEIEHRLTIAEQERMVLRLIASAHGRRITALEKQNQKRPSWTPRDYLLTAAGATIALAAIFEKIGWSTAIAGIVRLYGIK